MDFPRFFGADTIFEVDICNWRDKVVMTLHCSCGITRELSICKCFANTFSSCVPRALLMYVLSEKHVEVQLLFRSFV